MRLVDVPVSTRELSELAVLAHGESIIGCEVRHWRAYDYIWTKLVHVALPSSKGGY